MLYGAQLFSLRNQAKTPAEIRETFKKCHEMGFQVAQLSGCGPIDPYELLEITQEYSLPITVTHIPPTRLREDLDNVIREHKILGCDVVGLGAMPKAMRDSFEDINAFFREFKEIAEKVRDSGLRFAYHNHNFEFKTLENGRRIIDMLIEDVDWDIICDVCWVEIGGGKLEDVIPALKGRLENAHIKDASDFEEKLFCPVGQGRIRVETGLKLLEENGCKYCHVEQDNATFNEDPFGQMQQSIEYLKKHNYLR